MSMTDVRVDAYDFRAPVVHNEAQVKVLASGHLSVSMPEMAWAYAVAIPLNRESLLTSDSSDVLLVHIATSSIDGRIGIGILSHDEITLLDERTVTAADTGGVVELVGGAIAACGDLIIRNTHPDGVPGHIEIQSVDISTVRARPYNLLARVIHSEAKVNILASGHLSVSVPKVAWAYAAAIPLNRHLLPSQDVSDVLLVVHIAISKVDGTVGIGVRSHDEMTLLDETRVEEADAGGVVELLVRPLAACGDLIIRNAHPDGVPGRIDIKSIDVSTILPNSISRARTFSGSLSAEAEWASIPIGWEQPLDLLRRKWVTVPSGNDIRQSSSHLLTLSDAEIINHWERAHRHDTEGDGFGIRGWYHRLYSPSLAGKKLLDVGCGMGISSICFAEMGARTTFVDIVEDNVALVKRLCRIKGIDANFLYLERFEDLAHLDHDFDVVTALGSLINAPAAIIKTEINLIKQHLRVGGRWLHFAYPKSRWEREGSIAFSRWGELTDGPGTPWMEFHDRAKIDWFFNPSKIRILFECEWHNSDFNWFEIELIER